MSLLTSAKTLQAAAHYCLMQSDVKKKMEATLETQALWSQRQLPRELSGVANVDCHVGIPEKPELVPFNQLPRRSLTSEKGHAALIHSFVHIEFNAVNIAWDAVYRFPDMPDAFYDDWVKIAAEEAYHFQLLNDYLLRMGFKYGSFAAHAGLWETVEQTREDVMIRMALVPRVLEARGLDVTPNIIQRFRQHKKDEAADILSIIYEDEIGHVGVGSKWFRFLCEQRGIDSQKTFESLINKYAIDKIRQPFNLDAREQAGFSLREMEYLTKL